MTNAVTKPTTQKPSALVALAGKLHSDPNKLLEMLKATVFQKATNEELMALVIVANEYDLNPLLKEIYAFPAKGGGIVPIVSVDGWNKMLIRQPQFDGIEFDFDHIDGQLVSCTATIHVKGRSKPVKITEYLDECKRNTEPWTNMPHRMLRNRTLCQASRVAFGFSGIHNEDEATDIIIDTTIPQQLPPKQVAAPQGDAPAPKRTPQQEVESISIENGFTIDDVLKWGAESGNIETASSLSTFDEIPKADCQRILRAVSGFIQGVQRVKGVAQ